MELFFKAALKKYRFQTEKGVLNTESLFDLKLPELNSLAKSVNSALKEETEEDFLGETTTVSTELTEKLEIVKAVIKHKKDAQAELLAKRKRLEEKQFLAEIIEEREKESLKSLSIEELNRRLAELG